MFSLASVTLALSAAVSVAAAQPATPPAAEQGAAPAPNSTTICHFQTGPLAGQVRDYAGVTSVKPFAAGAPCTDGKDSVGIADRAGPSPSADRTGADVSATSYRCRFTAGPRSGQTAELPTPLGARPQRGASCADGQGSRGIVR